MKDDGDSQATEPCTKHFGIAITYRRGRHLVASDYMYSCGGVVKRLDSGEVVDRESANGETESEAEDIARKNLTSAAQRRESELQAAESEELDTILRELADAIDDSFNRGNAPSQNARVLSLCDRANALRLRG